MYWFGLPQQISKEINMKGPFHLLFCSICFCLLVPSIYSVKRQRPTHVFTDGDVIIGGLSPVHFSPTEKEELDDPDSYICQGKFNTRGFEAVEAMLFTMDMLNEGKLKDTVLPNITIGMDIKETCTSHDYAVRESLNFFFIRNAQMQAGQCSGYQPQKTREKKTVAVVGAAYSGVSMAVTNLCGLFYVPLVSYASTSRLLSNKVQFRYFLRTVPSDILQAQVMADLVRFMKWNYVVTLASDTEYGRSGIEAFKNAITRFNDRHICIAVDETFTKRSDESTFKRIFRRMKENPEARVVILFAQLHDADILIDKIRQERMTEEKYVWIGSDAWADSRQVLKGNEAILNGMFAVQPEVRRIKEFDEYFVNFNDKRRKRNLWMQEYEELKVTHDPAFHHQTFTHYPKAPYVMDAVLATAYALHDLLGCEPYKPCNSKISKMYSQEFQKQFVNYLEKVRFPAMSRDMFSFDQSGDAIGVYDIRHLKLKGENYKFSKIGRWGSGRECGANFSYTTAASCLKLLNDQIDTGIINGSSSRRGVPFSRCSRTCPAGFHKVSELDHAKCCWTCRTCTGNTITNTTDQDDCMRCPKGYWTNTGHSKCEPVEPTILHWADPLAVVIVCISGSGILAVAFVFFVFFLNRETPVVRASSRELCYVLLLGIAWCFITPLFFIAKPSDHICRALPLITGLCPALVVGTLLTKTNRISRIFNRKLRKTGAPNCLSKRWQVLMVACLTFVEITICAGCTFSVDTGSTLIISDSKKEILIECKDLPDIGLAIWWAYNAGLVVTCTYQAFLTRKLPEIYNEAKFITFTVLTICIVVAVFVPTYIGTSGVYRTTLTCFVFIIGGSASLGCMFVPKVYIILWRPEKNVPMQPRSQPLRLGTLSPTASFLRRLSIAHGTLSEDGKARERRPRVKRINSLPLIELSTDEYKNDIKKTRRSLSLSPDLLKSESLEENIKMGLPYHSQIEIIEEGNERDLSNRDCSSPEGNSRFDRSSNIECMTKEGISENTKDSYGLEYSDSNEPDHSTRSEIESDDEEPKEMDPLFVPQNMTKVTEYDSLNLGPSDNVKVTEFVYLIKDTATCTSEPIKSAQACVEPAEAEWDYENSLECAKTLFSENEAFQKSFTENTALDCDSGCYLRTYSSNREPIDPHRTSWTSDNGYSKTCTNFFQERQMLDLTGENCDQRINITNSSERQQLPTEHSKLSDGYFVSDRQVDINRNVSSRKTSFPVCPSHQYPCLDFAPECDYRPPSEGFLVTSMLRNGTSTHPGHSPSYSGPYYGLSRSRDHFEGSCNEQEHLRSLRSLTGKLRPSSVEVLTNEKLDEKED